MIKFSQTTTSLGRNGVLNTTGLTTHRNLWNDGKSFSISPITSKGLIGRCYIEIPIADIPQLIKELRNIQSNKSTD